MYHPRTAAIAPEAPRPESVEVGLDHLIYRGLLWPAGEIEHHDKGGGAAMADPVLDRWAEQPKRRHVHDDTSAAVQEHHGVKMEPVAGIEIGMAKTNRTV